MILNIGNYCLNRIPDKVFELTRVETFVVGYDHSHFDTKKCENDPINGKPKMMKNHIGCHIKIKE